MSEELTDATILPYFRLRLVALLPDHADLREQLNTEQLPQNLMLLDDMHPYEPQRIFNHLQLALRGNYPDIAQLSHGEQVRLQERVIYWARELHEHRAYRYFVLQSPIELVPKSEWQEYARRMLPEQIGGSAYHDYDTGRVPQEYQFLQPAAEELLRLLLTLTLREPWWDDWRTLTRTDIDTIVTYIARLTRTGRQSVKSC